MYGTCAITAITAQNTNHVSAIEPVSPSMVAAQIDSVMSDIGADAAKTGMLATRETVEVVASRVRRYDLRLVIDPVLGSTSGASLLEDAAIEALCSDLFPAAAVITPNLDEARRLTGSSAEPRELVRRLHAMGPAFVIVTGVNHASPKGVSLDLLFDGQTIDELEAPWVDTPHTHGTGCTFSAALAAYLAKGSPVPAAAEAAKQFVTMALQHAYRVGSGHSPLNHFFR